MKMHHAFLAGCLFLLSGWAQAENKPLPAADAFQLTSHVLDATHVDLEWQIAPNYHLYSDAFKITVLEPQSSVLAEWQLPDGKASYDPSRGQYLEYNDHLRLPLSLTAGTTDHLRLQVSYQGCADAGFCYPPQTRTLTLGTLPAPAAQDWLSASTNLTGIGQLLAQQSVVGIWLSFFLFGLLLAFTPCVFPMLPILSSIIVGHGTKLSTTKAFFLSLTYVLASALTYAVAGVAAGLAGSHWQSSLQNPWVLGVSGAMLALLSLSLFGFYELQLPLAWQQKLNTLGRQQHGGSYLGAALMGVLASLIVSPCVSAPLVGALAFISQSGSAWLGGSALLMMGLGMGLPLLFIGLSAGRWLPKAGRWMTQVKAFFGVSLLWMTIELWGRFLPDAVTFFLWGTLCIALAVYLGALDAVQSGWQRLWKALGLVLGLYGTCLIIGVLSGHSDPLQPLLNLPSATSIPATSTSAATPATSMPATTWTRVNNQTALDAELAMAVTNGQPVLLDFYADWCVSCHAMQREVWDQATVKQALAAAGWRLVTVDVTEQNASIKALEQRYGVIAPPTVLFLDKTGQLLPAQTLVGEQSSEALLTTLTKLTKITL